MANVLEVRHLNSYYRQDHSILRAKKERRQVLHDISFDIAEGEIVGLVGESGCGKTTLSRTILGMVGDYDGEIIHHSQRPQMVFQDPYSSLNPARSIGWILEEPLRIQGKLSAPERRQAVIALLEQVGLGAEFLTRKPHELSGGEMQRFCIARALGAHPSYLIADEVSTMLDAVTQAQIWRALVAEAEARAMGLIFVSHSPALAFRLATRVVELPAVPGAVRG